jgi:CMP-N,N'-diacetyllegionaminic acid synthase
MKVYAIIPARSGSKGYPDKNIKLIKGKPLLSYSIDFAKKIKGIDRVFCSTDSEKYAKIARSFGAEVPFLRSDYASTDIAMEDDILKDLRLKFLEFGIDEPDIIVWLRPTFLFRSKKDVESCVEKMRKNASITSARIVISVENRLYKIENEILLPEFNDYNRSMIRRQEMPNSYKVFNTDVFRFKNNKFGADYLGANIFPVVSNTICGMDIDNDVDFEIVKSVVEMESKLVDEYL